jgi:hypothetical protein
VSYRYQTPKYFLSQTYQLCLTDITHLLISCHRHSSCVIQTLHAYICFVRDTSIVSYKHDTPTYVLSQTLHLCLTDITHLHMSCHRHIYCILQTSHVYICLVRDIKCVLQISHAYICLVTDISVVSYRHYTPTNILSQTVQLYLIDITRLHMSCHRHINYVLQISPAHICLVTHISVVSYRHHTPTYVLSQTQQSYLTDITHLHISCHRHIGCVLQTSHVCIYLVTDMSIVYYRHHTSTYFMSQTQHLCLTDSTCLHMSCHRHIGCVLQTSHAYIFLVMDTSIVPYRHDTPTYVLS